MPHSPRHLDEIEVQYVKGVGEKRAEVLRGVGIESVLDLLNYFPRRYLDRSEMMKINQVEKDSETTVIGKVVSVELIRYPHKRLQVSIYDGSGILTGVWFNQVEFFKRLFKKDMEVAFNGKVGFYRGWQMVHPDYDVIGDSGEQLHTGQVIPLYPGSQKLRQKGFTSRSFRRIISQALQKYGDNIPETLPEDLVNHYRLQSRSEAYRQIHFPEKLEENPPWLRRFKYEELFFLQLMMAFRRQHLRSPQSGVAMRTDGSLIKKVLQQLPFELTGAQRKVLREIYSDLQSGQPMNRLLQGDVGSGKTLVALITALIAIENGCQAALMAPTEILAEQHFLNMDPLLQELNIRAGLLSGSLKSREKKKIQHEIGEGKVQLAIGTHALLQEPVAFANLGLVIIDEQHRFGVLQRGELLNKGRNPHTLVMTATPIPRTLSMTLYGDLDVSVIDELPPGRMPVITRWRQENKLPQIHDFLHKKIAAGEQAYIIYPLVEESEKLDLKAATESFEHLRKNVFPQFELALLHGRLHSREKELAMRRFKSGEVQILVSTTVVEVGVDVPNATILLIEHAERFGLSQLHQLRGRVGRGSKKSYCILVTPAEVNEIAEARLKLLEASSDGFLIAEQDLQLRGSGEFFGTRQHGMPDLQFADLVSDTRIIEAARTDAFKLVEEDPHLRLPRHRQLQRHFTKYYLPRYRIAQVS
ncbi:MAG: ATP-dependent DNA helicase RecG [Calditrichia bacterium]